MTDIPLIDVEKFNRLDAFLKQAGVDALICKLPENVVYLTGTYPVHGVSVAVYIRGGDCFLLQPECESQWVENNSTRVSFFSWGHLKDPALDESYADFLGEVYKKHLFSGMHIGIERNPLILAAAFRSSEMIVPDVRWFELVQRSIPGCVFEDSISLMELSRAIKSPKDIAKIRQANAIAGQGLAELAARVQPGMTEVEAAALVESTIRMRGTGFDGGRLVHAFAEVTSGPEGSRRQSMLVPSSQRKFALGDLVIIELAVVADGYWSDLTRVYCAGSPNSEQKRIHNLVLQAQFEAAKTLVAGNTFSRPDEAARKVLMDAGLGDYFIHGTGHGVGWRYHETIPQLGPGMTGTLERGMVTSVEPGVYIPGFGGIRIEDNIAVGENGPDWFSTPAEPW